jgi:hypothetical protein
VKFLRSLDLYKFIVLLAAVLLPLGWLWVRNLDESIRLCRQAITEATRSGGMLEQIGNLQKKVEVVGVNRFSLSDAIKNPQVYFQNQILAAGGTTLKSDDFGLPGDPKEESAFMGANSQQKASDYVADVTWKRNDLKVPMGFIYAVLFNAESGARVGGQEAGQQSVWKLRELQIVNATDERLTGSNKTPPAELKDDWSIKLMKFARREPRKQGN